MGQQESWLVNSHGIGSDTPTTPRSTFKGTKRLEWPTNVDAFYLRPSVSASVSPYKQVGYINAATNDGC